MISQFMPLQCCTHFPLLTGMSNNILILIVPYFNLIEATEYKVYCTICANRHYTFPSFHSDISVIALWISGLKKCLRKQRQCRCLHLPLPIIGLHLSTIYNIDQT